MLLLQYLYYLICGLGFFLEGAAGGCEHKEFSLQEENLPAHSCH